MTDLVDPETVVNEFIARILRMDLDGACELVTPDVEYDNVPMSKVFGPDGIRTMVEAMVGIFDEIEFVIVRQLSVGDTVMNERVDRFRAGDTWIDLPVAGVFVVNDEGLITLWRDYFDQPTLMDKIAALLPSE